MILTRTPLRLSFLGGGSDLPLFYTHEEGAAVSVTLNKFVYTSLQPLSEPGLRLAYSKVETVSELGQIEHPIIRAALQNFSVGLQPQGLAGRPGLSLISTADVGYGTGLGGSSSFTVGLVHALKARASRLFAEPMVADATELAMAASRIEIEQLGQPIGRQDHFAAAYGGLSLFRFMPSGEVVVERIKMEPARLQELECSCLLLDTGSSRSASAVLSSYRERLPELRSSIREMKTLALRLKTVLETSHGKNWIDEVGDLLHEGWLKKRDWSPEISSTAIDELYERGRQAGALGGKIVGAGGGGFLMLLVRPELQAQVRLSLSELKVFPIQFSSVGSELLQNSFS